MQQPTHQQQQQQQIVALARVGTLHDVSVRFVAVNWRYCISSSQGISMQNYHYMQHRNTFNLLYIAIFAPQGPDQVPDIPFYATTEWILSHLQYITDAIKNS